MGWFGSDKKSEEQSSAQTKQQPPEDVSKPIPRQKLPTDLQKIIDREDDFFDRLYEGNVEDSTESNVRYAAYAARARTILMSAHRYVAYTSDIGESFRPVAHPFLVRGAYAVSWAYLIGDVSHEGYKAYQRNQHTLAPSTQAYQNATGMSAPAGSEASAVIGGSAANKIPLIDDWRVVVAQRSVFQSIASMGLPAFTIHSIVRYSGRAMKNVKNVTLRSWGPIGLGLAAVPALPYMFDEPVEEAVNWIFHTGLKAYGGEAAVASQVPKKHGHRDIEGQDKKIKEL